MQTITMTKGVTHRKEDDQVLGTVCMEDPWVPPGHTGDKVVSGHLVATGNPRPVCACRRSMGPHT